MTSIASEDVMCKIRIKRRIENNKINGHVIINATGILLIQHAYIEIFGNARCSWKLAKLCREQAMRGSEQFYYTRHTLCGGEMMHAHVDESSYKFQCYWPSRLPGTWFGDHGSVQYTGLVTILLHEDGDMFTYKQHINVKFRRHLDTERHLMFESRVDTRRSFFSTRSLGCVKVSVWLPICGIGAGQSIPVVCTVVNRSRLHFGSLIFVLTRTDIYRSDTPVVAVKKVRTDVCRVARTVNIHKGKYEYYSNLQTEEDTIPTNQFYSCTCIQVIYELWVSVQGVFPRYRTFGYPNIDTPGIPVIIGTHPLRDFDTMEITREIHKKMYEYHVPILVDELPDEFKQMIHTTDEDINKQAIDNLERQLQENEKLLTNLKRESSARLTE